MGEWVIPLRLLGLLEHLAVLKIPSKLEVAPLYAKCLVDGWMVGYPLDCYDY